MFEGLLSGTHKRRARLGVACVALGAFCLWACEDNDYLSTPPNASDAGAGGNFVPDAGGHAGSNEGGRAGSNEGGRAGSNEGGDAGSNEGGHAGSNEGGDAGSGGTSGEAGAAEAGAAGEPATAQPPIVRSVVPTNGANNVPSGTRPTAVFSKSMDASTLNALTFTLKQGLNPVAGTVSFDGPLKTATFTPQDALALGLTYTATISTSAKDTEGLALVAPYSWSFTTAACEQAPVVLGAAANFAVLAGSTVTNTGLSVVTGDLGVSPGSAVTGFPPGILVGAQHATDPTAALGIADLTTAYDSAKGRTLCPVTVSGNLGGLTLAPGLYKSTTSLAVSSGDLTLDAQGDGNAIFIFQMATTLTTTAGRKVILSNGARAANIYWQVGSSATIGTTSVFQGTIMADQAITLGTGAQLNGRALARVAAVNLASNAIVTPTP